MRPKSVLLLVLALGCGLVASIGISQVMDRSGADKGPAGETVPVFVAKVNIPFGEKITESMVGLENWPKEKTPEGFLTKLEDVVGQTPRNQILKGFPIVQAMLGSDDMRASTQIPAGFRVAEVKVTQDKGGTLLRVGDRVDVQAFFRPNQQLDITSPTIKTILRDIGVFAVNGTFQNREGEEQGGTPAAIVSLIVTPEQAQLVTLAKSAGEINLIPRRATDKEDVALDPLNFQDFFNREGEGSGREKDQTAKTDEPSGVKGFIDNQNGGAQMAAPDPESFVMIAWVNGTPVRYTFNDLSEPPLELNGEQQGSQFGTAAPPAPQANNDSMGGQNGGTQLPGGLPAGVPDGLGDGLQFDDNGNPLNIE